MTTTQDRSIDIDRFPQHTHYEYQGSTLSAACRIPPGTVANGAHNLGMRNGEPLIVIMDSLVRYASAYLCRFDRSLAEDGFLGDPWLQAAKGIRALLNGDGAIAMRRGITTDSKDNGAVEQMFWNALNVAGFKEEDL